MFNWLKKLGGNLAISWREFNENNGMMVAAATVYFIIQSIIPLILGLLVIAAFVLEGPALENFEQTVTSTINNGSFDIKEIITGLKDGAPGLLSIAAVLLVWSGSGIFGQLIQGVNLAYGVKKDKRNFFLVTGLRLLMFVILGGLIVLSIVISVGVNLVFGLDIAILGVSPKTFSFLVPLISNVVPLLILTLGFGFLYKLSPDVEGVKWKNAFGGGFLAAVMFGILQFGFSQYITAFGAADTYTKSYGALGGILLFMLYLWVSSNVIVFGAQFAAVLGGFYTPNLEAEKPNPVIEFVKKLFGAKKTEDSTTPEALPPAGGTGTLGAKPLAVSTSGTGIAMSTQNIPAKSNPVSIVIGGVSMGIMLLVGLLMSRRRQ